jgi:transcriptional repressor NF-X1
MSETATASPTNPTVLEPSSHSNHRGRGSGNRFRNPRPREGAQSQPASSSNTHRRDKPRAARADIIPPDGAGQTAAQRLDQGEGPGPASGESHQRRNNGRRDPGRAPQQRRSNPSLNTPNDRVEGETTDSAAQNDRPNTNSRPPRRKQFGSNLTSDAPAHSSRETSSTLKSRNDSSTDLTSRLIHAFTHRSDGLDCPICFVSIHPAQPTWSCSPSSENNTCCWTTFHLKCIRAWASKSRF